MMKAIGIRGKAAELKARRFLLANGLTFVTANYNCRMGEIDLIMREGETYVFCEVRARSENHFGGAASSINHSKQQRLIRAAQLYLQHHSLDCPCRIDAVCFDGPLKTAKPTWLKNIIVL